MIRHWIAGRLDALIEWLVPLDLHGMGEWADELAEWEAEHEVHESGDLWFPSQPSTEDK